MSTRTKEEIQEIWAATNAPHTKSNKPPRLTKKEKKLIGVGKDEGRAVLKYARISSRKVKIHNRHGCGYVTTSSRSTR